MKPERTTGNAVVRRSPRTTTLGLLAAALVVPLALMVGCSKQTGDLAGAPEPAGGQATGPRDVQGSSTTQSYEIRGQDSEQAITAYERLAVDAGWTTSRAPEPTGDTDWSLTMTKGTATLEVTTSPFENDSGSESDIVELSLQVTKGS